jgi:signal peptidase II
MAARTATAARPAGRRLAGRGFLAAALAVLALDRLTKWLVVEALDLRHHLAIEVLPPYLNFVMAWNRGINFGLGAGGPEAMRWVLIAFAVAASVALAWWTVRRRGERGLAIAAGVVAGGAIGNAWDRVVYGAVADFLNMSCCGIDNPYAFNVADVAIFAGAAFLAWKA